MTRFCVVTRGAGSFPLTKVNESQKQNEKGTRTETNDP